ncbi:MAG TPA: hypothetical protein VGD40_17805 [Chryseosolibacter sp.]
MKGCPTQGWLFFLRMLQNQRVNATVWVLDWCDIAFGTHFPHREAHARRAYFFYTVGMRFRLLLPIAFIACTFVTCSESEEPAISIVETLDVNNSLSSSRTFRGNLEHVAATDTILSYGFEWESRYGTWKAFKKGHINKGHFAIKDRTSLSKWSSFTVRAFIETRHGVTYGNVVTFATEGQ